ncbi:recombination regulator RecX [Clostridium senegalense]
MKYIISKIQVQKNNKDRVNVYVNDEFLFACSNELVYYHNLKKGLELDKNKIIEVVEEDNYIKAKNAALKILERSYKTEKEMYDKLLSKEYDDKTIQRVIEFLKEYSFVDDVRYAELYIKDKIKVHGKSKIKFSLVNKGISEEIIESKLNTISNEQEELTALKLGEKKYKTLIKSEKNYLKLKKKLSDYLLRNGYNFSIINKVVNSIITCDDFSETVEQKEVNFEELHDLALKRLNVLKKSEANKEKLYKKLYDYLLRRGYKYDEIKTILKEIL